MESANRGLTGGAILLRIAVMLAMALAGADAWAQDPSSVEAPASAEAAPEEEPLPEEPELERVDEPAEADTNADTPEDVTGADEAERDAPEPRGWVSGSFEAEFDGLWSDEGSDIDLEQTLRLRVDPPAYPWLHLRGALWLEEDLDSEPYYRSAVRDFSDIKDDDFRANLLYMYAEVDDLWGDSALRIGRQRILETPLYLLVDGLYFKQRQPGWEWYVFGGARGSIYFDTHDDEVFGGGVAWQVSPKTRIALDGFYGDEERDDDLRVWPVYRWFGLNYPRRVHGERDNDYFSLSLWQWFSPELNFFGRFGIQDGDAEDLVLSLNGTVPPIDVSYEVTYRGQLNDNKDEITAISSFYRILGELERYDDLLLAAHKPLNEIFTVSLEAQFHNSRAGGDDTWANRDFQRYGVMLSADDLWPTVDAALGLEYWDVDEGEGTWAVTGEVSKEWERIELTLGADYERWEDRVVEYNPWMWVYDRLRTRLIPGQYARFSPVVFIFDTYGVETHEDIYSIYSKLRYELTEDQDLSLKVTFEEDDGPESPYWRVQAGYTINF